MHSFGYWLNGLLACYLVCIVKANLFYGVYYSTIYDVWEYWLMVCAKGNILQNILC